tara:strand:+ start:994 stop:1113 length:120 start_codon:yes stop_codon:yes gene_type:complete
MKKRNNVLIPKKGIKIKHLDSLIHNILFKPKYRLKDKEK